MLDGGLRLSRDLLAILPVLLLLLLKLFGVPYIAHGVAPDTRFQLHFRNGFDGVSTITSEYFSRLLMWSWQRDICSQNYKE